MSIDVIKYEPDTLPEFSFEFMRARVRTVHRSSCTGTNILNLTLFSAAAE